MGSKWGAKSKDGSCSQRSMGSVDLTSSVCIAIALIYDLIIDLGMRVHVYSDILVSY